MNAFLSAIRNWGTPPGGVTIIEEKEVFDVTGSASTANFPLRQAWSGRICIHCKFFQVGDLKIPATDRPTVTGGLTAPGGHLLSFNGGGFELKSVEVQEEFVCLLVENNRTGHMAWLRTQIVAVELGEPQTSPP